jgi:hypothetical protein
MRGVGAGAIKKATAVPAYDGPAKFVKGWRVNG